MSRGSCLKSLGCPVFLAAQAVLFAFSPPPALDAEELNPSYGPYPGFEVRYGMGPLPDSLESIVGNPTVLSTSTAVFRDPTNGRFVLEGLGEAQAIYDVPLDVMASVLTPDAGQKTLGPGVLENRVEESDDRRAVVYQVVGANFLGVKVAFATRSEVFRDSFPDGSIGLRARLMENPDGKLYESYNSWYLAPIQVGGRTMTYMRFYMRSGIYNPFSGEESIMKLFLPHQLSNMFASNVKEARKMMGMMR